MDLRGRVSKLHDEGGLSRVLRRVGTFIYRVLTDFDFTYRRLVRPLKPGERVYANGIPLSRPKLLERNMDDPYHEEVLVARTREHVQRGDTVTVVGGGEGVSTVAAAHAAGPSGHVIVYEGSAEQTKRVRECCQLNDVDSRVTIHHSIVSEDRGVYGDKKADSRTRPDELSECDVLQLDCEGAEIPILGLIDIRPRTIIVETHGMYDAPPKMVRSLLEDCGYTVSNETVAIQSDDDRRTFCEKNGIYILVGQRNDEN